MAAIVVALGPFIIVFRALNPLIAAVVRYLDASALAKTRGSGSDRPSTRSEVDLRYMPKS